MAGPNPAAKQANKLTPVAKFGIGVLACVFIAGVYYFFFYTDLTKAVNISQQRTAQLRMDENAAANTYNAFVRDSALLEEKKNKVNEFNRVLPETTDQQSFLNAINQQADISGIKVKTTFLPDEQIQQHYARIPMKLELSGKYHQVAKFFAGIGRVDRIINIENIEIGSPAVNENDETILAVRCQATTFRAVVKK